MTYFIVAWIAAGFTASLAYIFSLLDDNEPIDWMCAIILLLFSPLGLLVGIVKVLTKKK